MRWTVGKAETAHRRRRPKNEAKLNNGVFMRQYAEVTVHIAV